jgi:hypothetical protein
MKETCNINPLLTKALKGKYLLAKTRKGNAGINEMMASQHPISTEKMKCMNVIG